MTDKDQQKGRYKIPENVLKEIEHKTELVKEQWHANWGWQVEEYIKLQQKMAEISKDDPILKEKALRKVVENRTVKPFPNTTNHVYGWLIEKEEFSLQKWGPDVLKYPPYQPKY